MLATSIRHPSKPCGPSHRATVESGPSYRARRSPSSRWSNFGSDGCPNQRDVLVGVVGEREVPGLRRTRVGYRPLEPLVPGSAVVGRQVAHEAHPARMHRVREARERPVTAEQRVDLVERRGVVAVVGARREDRRQVDRVGPRRRDVVQAGGDAVEVTAVVLERRLRTATDDRVVPRLRDRPVRRGPVDRLREPVREDLVEHGSRRPRRRGRMGRDPEVGGVGDVVLVQAFPVQPPVPVRHAVEQPAVVHHRVVDPDVAAQPQLVVGLAVDRRLGELLLAVDVGPEQGLRHAARPRHPEEHRDGVPDVRCEVRHVGRRAVMVRDGREVHGRPVLQSNSVDSVVRRGQAPHLRARPTPRQLQPALGRGQVRAAVQVLRDGASVQQRRRQDRPGHGARASRTRTRSSGVSRR